MKRTVMFELCIPCTTVNRLSILPVLSEEAGLLRTSIPVPTITVWVTVISRRTVTETESSGARGLTDLRFTRVKHPPVVLRAPP